MRKLVPLIIFLLGILVERSVCQMIEICELPEKDTTCILQCTTKDYNSQPVTFSHRPNNDVGSCIPPNQCVSNYDRYDLTQKKIGNDNITYFYIQKLNRAEDEGKWICSYGNKPSAEKYLTVHTRPENIDVSVNDTGMTIEITCSCYCVYPQESIRMEIQISNEENKIKRRLSSLQSENVPGHKCEIEERTAIGVYNIEKEKWPGNFIDISCIGTEQTLSHTQTAKKRYMFLGLPKLPKHVNVNAKTSHSAVVSWEKSANSGSLQTFVILYKESSTNYIHTIFRQEKENRMYEEKLVRLKPDTTYDVQIYSFNKNGNSSLTDPFYFTTAAEEEEHTGILTFAIIAFIVGVINCVIIIAILLCYNKQKMHKRMKGKKEDAEKEVQYLTTKRERES